MLVEDDLRRRTCPVLSDGTQLRELIDFEQRTVSLRVLDDPEIFRLELDRIFARSWCAVAHESEIPDNGDFVLRYIGLDPVIVTRGTRGEVSVLLNSCSHRGMEVCSADFGNAKRFMCPYHGWSFDTSGKLLGAPLEKRVYGADWDKDAYGLTKAHVTVRSGLIFASFDPSPPPRNAGHRGAVLLPSYVPRQVPVLRFDPGQPDRHCDEAGVPGHEAARIRRRSGNRAEGGNRADASPGADDP